MGLCGCRAGQHVNQHMQSAVHMQAYRTAMYGGQCSTHEKGGSNIAFIPNPSPVPSLLRTHSHVTAGILALLLKSLLRGTLQHPNECEIAQNN